MLVFTDVHRGEKKVEVEMGKSREMRLACASEWLTGWFSRFVGSLVRGFINVA